jgi:hypothetical protein
VIHTLHQSASIEHILTASDIGGTTDTTKYVDMQDWGTVDIVCQLGNTFEGTPSGWSATDSLDEFYLVQASDAAGTGSKTIAGANNDQTDAQTGAAGDIHVITLHTEALDMDNNFSFVGAIVVEDSNTGVDLVNIIAVRYNARYAHKAATTSKTTIIV